MKGRLAPISIVGWDRHHITRARGIIFVQLLWVGGLKDSAVLFLTGVYSIACVACTLLTAVPFVACLSSVSSRRGLFIRKGYCQEDTTVAALPVGARITKRKVALYCPSTYTAKNLQTFSPEEMLGGSKTITMQRCICDQMSWDGKHFVVHAYWFVSKTLDAAHDGDAHDDA